MTVSDYRPTVVDRIILAPGWALGWLADEHPRVAALLCLAAVCAVGHLEAM